MKRYIILLLLLLNNCLFAQFSNGKIEYSLTIADDEEMSKGELGEYFKLAKTNATYLSFILEFNKNEMIFYTNPNKIDDIDTSFSTAFSGVDGLYYRKTNDSTVLNLKNNELIGKAILRTFKKTEWTIHSENKKIGELLCYKATAVLKFNNGVGDFQRDLIAWFCPEIPYSFGPKAYGNLPGLILEFQEKNILFRAKKINLNIADINISAPSGKIYTEKEYSNLINEYFENEKD